MTFYYMAAVGISVYIENDNPREFHTAADDHAYPFGFSIIVEP